MDEKFNKIEYFDLKKVMHKTKEVDSLEVEYLMVQGDEFSISDCFDINRAVELPMSDNYDYKYYLVFDDEVEEVIICRISK